MPPPKKKMKQKYVLVRMTPEGKEFWDALRESTSAFINSGNFAWTSLYSMYRELNQVPGEIVRDYPLRNDKRLFISSDCRFFQKGLVKQRFSKGQANVIRALLEAYRRGRAWRTEEQILQYTPDANRLVDIFRGRSGWKNFILVRQVGVRKLTHYRLNSELFRDGYDWPGNDISTE
jgi:hypothetical protein